MKRAKKILIPISVILAVILIIGVAYLIKRYTPSKEQMPLTEYYNVENGKIKVIIQDEVYETPGLYLDDQVYLDIDLVTGTLNQRFYWDKNENLLLYTTSTAVISAQSETTDCYINKSKETKDYTIVKIVDGSVYVAADYVAEFTALEYKKFSNPDRVVLTHRFGEKQTVAQAAEDAKIRVKPSIKSPYLIEEKKAEEVLVIEKEDKETGFCKVMSEGVVGYMRADDLNEYKEKMLETNFKEETYTHIRSDEKINLVWHQVTNKSANANLDNLLAKTKGVNVIAPTWFATSDNNGNIASLADYNYVEKAHRAGLEVWALCDDFSPDMKIGTVLGTTTKRQKLEKNLIAEAIRYSLDGINIDFENIKKESAADFVQFVRELGIMCRNNGIVLSIDNYPPTSYTEYYNRKEQAAVADYVVTMAYDEHYAGSEEAGPVASLSYIEDSVDNVLKEVPAEQAIIALPFYSRHWTEKTKNGKVSLSSEACSMSYAADLAKDSGAQVVWDEASDLNYVEYTQKKAIHKIWIEDEKSLELKMQKVSDAKTAGFAFWKLGLEKASVWDMIIKYKK